MARSVKPWSGKSDNTPVPPRVRLRNFEQHGGMCHLCSLKIQVGQKWQTDHVVALINRGKNDELNLAPAHDDCHKAKSADDVAEKASVSAKRKKHLGMKRPSKLSSPREPKPAMTSKALPPRKLYEERT